MLKLILTLMVEAIVGVAGAALMLAVVLPLLIRHRFIMPGDLAGTVVIGVVGVFAVGAILLRRGSALHRFGRRDE